MASCLKISCELPSYLDNELSHSEKLIVEKHLHECPSCRLELTRYQKCAADLYEQFSPHKMQHDLNQYVMEHLPELGFSTVDVAGLNKRAKHPSLWRERVMRLMPVGVAAVLVVLAFLISEQWPTEEVWDNQVVGILSSVSGDVVRSSNFGKTEDEASLKQFSSKGEKIETAEESSAVVTLKGGSDITMDEKSTITFQDDRQVRVDSGQVYFDVAPSSTLFRVLTPFGDITVFGTEFNVLVEADSVRVDVAEGVVRFEKGELYETLNEGDSVEVRGNAEQLQPRYGGRIAERTLWATKIQPNTVVKNEFLAKYDAFDRPSEILGLRTFILHSNKNAPNAPLEAIVLTWDETLNSNDSLAGYHVYVRSFDEDDIFHRFIKPSEFRNATDRRLVLVNNGKQKRLDKPMYAQVIPDFSYGRVEIPIREIKPVNIL